MKKKIIVCILVALSLLSFLIACENEPKPKALIMSEVSYDNQTKLISWQNVENAVGYTVILNGTEYQTQENSFLMSELNNGEYEISVIAKGDNVNYLNSNAKTISEIYTITKETFDIIASNSLDYIADTNKPLFINDLNKCAYLIKDNKYRVSQNEKITYYEIEYESEIAIENKYVQNDLGKYDYYCDYQAAPFKMRNYAQNLVELASLSFDFMDFAGGKYISKYAKLDDIRQMYIDIFETQENADNLHFLIFIVEDGNVILVELGFKEGENQQIHSYSFVYNEDLTLEMPTEFYPILGLSPLLAFEARINERTNIEQGKRYYLFQAQVGSQYTIKLLDGDGSIKIMEQTKTGSVIFADYANINNQNNSFTFEVTSTKAICLVTDFNLAASFIVESVTSQT